MDNVATVVAADSDGNVQFWSTLGTLAKGVIKGGIQLAAQHGWWVST